MNLNNYGLHRNNFPATELHDFFATAHACMSNKALDCREWGVETTDGLFVRWKPCGSPKELSKLVTKHKTGKLNVGAVYDRSVSERRRMAPMKPVAREFVIDVDLDDYGNVDKHDLEGCDRYWPVVAIGLTAVRRILEWTFGFRHFLLVYSGRRGGHLWVLDRRAREMDNEHRGALVSFLQKAMKGGSKDGERSTPSYDWVRSNPNLVPMVGILVRFFERCGVKALDEGGVGMLDEAYQREELLLSIDKKLHDRLISAVRPKTGQQALKLLKKYIMRESPEWVQLRYEDAVLELVFPRLDVNVSKDMGHMLKTPFSVHPATGRVSVPLPHGCDATAHSPRIRAPTAPKVPIFSAARHRRDVFVFAGFYSALCGFGTIK